MVEFLENILALSLKQDLVYFHQSLAEEWLFFAFLIKKRKVFVAEENSGSHKWEIFNVLWIFSNFSFWGEPVNRNSIRMIGKGYHYMINLSIVSNFYISTDLVSPGSLPKDLL